MATFPARGRKIAPPHPGPVIAGVLEDSGISARKAAAAIGLSHTLLAKVLSGAKPVTPATAVLLEAYFGNAPKGAQLWLDMQRDFDVWQERQKLAKAIAAVRPIE